MCQSRSGICCLQNLKKSTACYVSFLVVGGARYNNLSFTLDKMSQHSPTTIKFLLIRCALESLCVVYVPVSGTLVSYQCPSNLLTASCLFGPISLMSVSMMDRSKPLRRWAAKVKRASLTTRSQGQPPVSFLASKTLSSLDLIPSGSN